jgi:hypothetical protein
MVWYATTLPGNPSPEMLNAQVHFIWYELNTFSYYGLSALRTSGNVTNATIAFETDFEGCGDCQQSNRVAYAKAVLSAYGDEPPAIESFTASPSILPWSGGTVHLSVSGNDSASYAFSSSVAGLSGLTTGRATDTVAVPANATTDPVTYTITVTATLLGVSASRRTPITVSRSDGTNLVTNPEFSDGVAGWARTRGTNYAAYAGASGLPVGTTFLQANKGTSSLPSFFQDVATTVTAGDSYDASVWVKAASGATASGTLVLWGLGGSNENGHSTFTVGSTWTQVDVAFDATSSHSDLRLQVYLHGSNQYDFVDAQLR